ncbi:MAG: AAA family ATPase [Sandaracinaceae bacterium]
MVVPDADALLAALPAPARALLADETARGTLERALAELAGRGQAARWAAPFACRDADLGAARRVLARELPPLTGGAVARATADLVGRLGAPSAGEAVAAAQGALDRTDLAVLRALRGGVARPPPPAPFGLGRVRATLRRRLGSRPRAVRDRAWAAAVRAPGDGAARVAAALAAVDGPRPEATITVGVSGSGKSTFVARVLAPRSDVVVSLDDLRAARGDRADQSHNDAVVQEALARWSEQLAGGRRVVWDATSLIGEHRAAQVEAARAAGALLTGVLFLVPADVLRARNESRRYRIPDEALAWQLSSMDPPYPEILDRLVVVDRSGRVGAVLGGL